MGNIYSNKLRAHWQYCKSVLKSKTTCASCVNCVEFGHWHGFNWIPKTVQHRLRERCKWAAAARFVPQANFLETNARFWARSWLYPCSTKTREVLGNRSAREISWDLSEARGKSRGLKGNLITSRVLVEYGHFLIINISTGSWSGNSSLGQAKETLTVLKSILPCWWWEYCCVVLSAEINQ